LRAKEKSIEKYKSQIHEHRQRQAEADGGQHAQKISELEEARGESSRAREELANHESRVPTLLEELQMARRRKEDQEGKVKEKMEGAARARQHIQELEQGQGNWVDPYPNPANLPKLLRAIDNERGFRERPVGPMGRHVKLLKPEWSSILETSSGNSLNAFVVTSKSDQVILSDLMRRMNW
jgi:chromosome segregation ATPase